MKKSCGIVCLFIVFISMVSVAGIPDCDGFPCTNYAVGANVSLSGRMLGHLIYNTPRLGAPLEEAGQGQFRFNMGDVTLHDTDFQNKSVERKWPFAYVSLSDPRLDNLVFKFRIYAPLSEDDNLVSCLPAVLAEVTVENLSQDQDKTVKLALVTDNLLRDQIDYVTTPQIHGVKDRWCFTGWAMPSNGIGKYNMGWLTMNLKAGQKKMARFIYTRFEDNMYVGSKFSNQVEVADYVSMRWNAITKATEKVDALIPATGDQQVDDYARWYMTCAMLMTKTLKDGTIVNMGYHELNQRDSFWTSWIQLVHWPAMDKKMIEESAEHQREDGKIPTTVLPLIERNDDIDITTFFILRIIRYSNFHNDLKFAEEMFPYMMKAFDFLYSLDDDKVGVPMQHSFWGDWKDVPGMAERKYSPYSTMLFTAALRDASVLADRLGKKEIAADLHAKYKVALAFLNKPASEGGMFNGTYYEQVWKDPSRRTVQVMQDQVVGILFNVVTDEVADSILATLDKNMTPYGPAETFPYFKDFGYDPGDYHNGGVWPYMSHLHAWALLKRGQQDKAMDIIRKVGHADLVKDGDYLPHEYVQSVTGENRGPKIQGWNASIFAALYFGYEGNHLDNTKSKFFFGLF